MKPELDLFGVDQYGYRWSPLDPKSPRKSLLELTSRVSASPMYIDKKSGGSVQIGYVLPAPRGFHEVPLWITLYWEDLSGEHHPWEK